MKPLTRKEMLLDGVAKGNLDTFKPATREEVFIKKAFDPKYLPVMTVEMRRNDGETINCSKTFDEILTHIKNGGIVEAYFFYSATSSSPTATLRLNNYDNHIIRFDGVVIGFAGDGTLTRYQVYAAMITDEGGSAWGRHSLIE